MTLPQTINSDGVHGLQATETESFQFKQNRNFPEEYMVDLGWAHSREDPKILDSK